MLINSRNTNKMSQLIYQTPEPEKEDVIESIAKGIRTLIGSNKITILDHVSMSERKVNKLNQKLATATSKYSVEPSDVISIYDSVPDEIVTCIREKIVGMSGSMTYEEILKHFMQMSSDVDNPLSQSMNIAKIDKYFGEKMVYNMTCSINSGTLAIIWSALLLSIYSKHASSIDSYNCDKIIKCGVALALSFGVMFMQYEHKNSGSPTNYISKLSSVYYKYRGNSLPDLLNLDKMKNSISEASYTDKIRMGQLFNMVYTFRIGDTCISKLTKGSSFIDINSIIRAAWPLPTDYEISKMYRLYTEPYIY